MSKVTVLDAEGNPVIRIGNELVIVKNGLAEALGCGGLGIGGGTNPIGYPFNQLGGEAVEQSGTLYQSMRWYLVSNMRQLLNQCYAEIGLMQTICDVPVDDGLRGGIEVKSSQLDEEQIKELLISLDRDNDLVTAGQAAKWNRLFGGAGIVTLTDQDPETPLDIQALGPDEALDFRAADLWELFYDKQNVEDESFSHYSYYGQPLHKSRVMMLRGIEPPSFLRPRLRGWGLSALETLVRSINQYLKATNLTFEVLDEFKVDIFKIKNFAAALMSPLGTQKIRERVQLANWQKNYQHAIAMDTEDDWDHKQLSFAGLGEAMQGIRMQVASDMRMPLTKLFGISASGFNSGEDDIEVYNAMVESQVRNKLKYHLLRMLELKCQKLFEFIPDDLEIKFKSLRMLSAVDEETVKTQKFTRLIQAKQAGELTTEEFRDACNKGNLFDVHLDTSDGALSDLEDDAAEDEESEDEEKKPGEAKPETKKPRANSGKAAPVARAARAERREPDSARAERGERPSARRRGLKPYTLSERLERVMHNSATFDRAAYAADGGEGWIDPRREEFFINPTNVDKQLWEKAEDASMAAFGQIKWQFVVWMYRKLGGKFT